MKNLKLIYISHWRFPSEKTMSPLIMKTCEMFASAGIGVELWVPWRNNQFRGPDPHDHHNVRKNFVIRRIPTIDFTGIIPGKLPFYVMLATFNLGVFVFSLLKGNARNSVFYFHDLRDAVSVALLKSLLFLEIHDFYKSNLLWLNNLVFSKVSGFIVTNAIKMKKLKEEFKIDPVSMLHQPNGVDLKLFEINLSKIEARVFLDLPLDKKVILYAGHLFDWKGVDTLFDANQFLYPDEVIYFVGGTDKDINKFKIKSEKLKVKNVIIAGRKPHVEIPIWFRAADVLVLPNTAKFEASKYETSPVKLFEYMASGTPIVASDLPSIRNIVDETMVFFFKPDSPDSLSLAVHSVLGDFSVSKKAFQALEKVKQYSWDIRTQNIISFIYERASKP